MPKTVYIKENHELQFTSYNELDKNTKYKIYVNRNMSIQRY